MKGSRVHRRRFSGPQRLCLLVIWLRLLLPTAASHAADATRSPSELPGPAPRTQIAALGRVEPIAEEIRIAAAMTGRLADVLLDEGQPVQQGQVVATLENADHLARVQAAEASVGIARAALERVINGAHPAERKDSRVLEVLIDLEPGLAIPVGLRVTTDIAIPAP